MEEPTLKSEIASGFMFLILIFILLGTLIFSVQIDEILKYGGTLSKQEQIPNSEYQTNNFKTKEVQKSNSLGKAQSLIVNNTNLIKKDK